MTAAEEVLGSVMTSTEDSRRGRPPRVGTEYYYSIFGSSGGISVSGAGPTVVTVLSAVLPCPVLLVLPIVARA